MTGDKVPLVIMLSLSLSLPPIFPSLLSSCIANIEPRPMPMPGKHSPTDLGPRWSLFKMFLGKA